MMNTTNTTLEIPQPSEAQLLLQLELLLPLKFSPSNGNQAEKCNSVESSRKRRRAEERERSLRSEDF